MNTNRTFPFISIFLVVPLLLSACGGNPPAVPTFTPVLPAPTATVQPVQVEPASTATAETVLNSVDGCTLSSYSFTNVGFGLPKPSYKLPTVGTVKTIVLFVDFNDAPASQTPQELFAMISPDAETFFRDISYGRMDYVLEPHFVWLRMGQPSAHYGEGIRSYEGHLQFIQEAVDLADESVDFSNVDSVVVMVPPQASAIGYGPAFGANPSEGYSADGKVFANGVTSGADLTGWGFLWLNHETGHTMSLPDLYAYQYDASNYDDQHRFVGGFGLMGFIDGKAPEFFGFERWQLGWLDDGQIVCQEESDQTTSLTAIETAGGLKAVMVPISESKVVVVESRRALGYDKNIVKAGALVYTVDTSIYSGEGPLVVYPILENDPYRDQSPLAVGESVTVDGVTVTVLAATDEGDTVQVTIVK